MSDKERQDINKAGVINSDDLLLSDGSSREAKPKRTDDKSEFSQDNFTTRVVEGSFSSN